MTIVTTVTEHIAAQHRDIASVLKTLQAIVEGDIEARREDDIARLYDICHYVRVFPDRLHHPDEERCLFAPLEVAAPGHVDLIRSVRAQHERCGSLTAALEAALRAFDERREDAAALRAVVHDFLRFQFEHMRQEEHDILPLAEDFLPDNQRAAAATVFANHADPLFGENLAAGFEALRRRIVRHA